MTIKISKYDCLFFLIPDITRDIYFEYPDTVPRKQVMISWLYWLVEIGNA